MQASLLDTDQFGQTSAGGARAKPVLRAEPSAGSITPLEKSRWAAQAERERGKKRNRKPKSAEQKAAQAEREKGRKRKPKS